MKGPKFWQPNRLFDLLDNVIKHAWFLPDLLIHEKSATYIRIRIHLELKYVPGDGQFCLNFDILKSFENL